MAEKKKEITGTELDKKAFEEITALILGLVLLGALVTAVLNYLDSFAFDSSIFANLTDYFLNHIWPKWKLVAAILSGALFFGILNNAWQLRAINLAELNTFNPGLLGGVADVEEAEETKNARWERILSLANSESASDRRMAVMEADVMLEELLAALGYTGDSVGEILKSIDENQFSSIDAAWEAHKVRNTLAHSGSEFEITSRETKRVIALFEKVFREFGAI